METIIKAIDKAVRAGVYTLEETSIILKEIESVVQIINPAGDGPEKSPEEIKSVKK
tara:strand:+ start:342 stop:509 length:168 start_codon:yes stop_codon:yes gene_type:complete